MLIPMLYIYTWFILPTLLIFFLTIKYPLKAVIGKGGTTLSDQIHDKFGNGNGKKGMIIGAKSITILLISLIISVLLFRLLGSGIKFLYGLITFIGCFSLFYKLIAPSTENFNTRAAALSLAPGFVLGESWLLFPSWQTYNLVVLALAYTLISTFQVRRLRFLFIILVSFIVFDAIAVWGLKLTAEVAQGSASNAIQTQAPVFIPPISLIVPGPADITRFVLDPLVFLGIGDIIIPGIAIAAASHYKLHVWAILAYIAGIILALLFAVFLSLDIPVLTLTNPLIILSILTGAKLTGKYQQLEW